MSASTDTVAVLRRIRDRKSVRSTLALLLLGLRRKRAKRFSRCRVDPDVEIETLLRENMFERTFRMSAPSFAHLLSLLTPHLEVNEQQATNSSGEKPISTCNMLMTTLRYLAGGSYLDIRRTVGISRSSYYRVIDLTLKAILSLDELRIRFPDSDSEKEVAMRDFRAISSGGVTAGCVGCVDGWLCCIKSPSSTDAGDVGTGRYFSGHYARPGINVQAVCDAHCRFIAVDASYPGSTNDARAFRYAGVAQRLSSFTRGMYIIGDNAYSVSEHLLTPFSRNQVLDEYYDSFNFHASQLRIRIEMAFGLLTTKWRIFRRPIERNLSNACTTIHAAMMLHNYVINRRMIEDADYSVHDDTIRPLRVPDNGSHVNDVANLMGYMSSHIAMVEGQSAMRDFIVETLRRDLTMRPQFNIQRNGV